MAATLVQSVKGRAGSGTSLNVGPTTFTAGNFLTIEVSSQAGATVTVSDSTHSVTATLVGRGTASGTAVGGAQYWIQNITGGSTTIAVAGMTSGGTVSVKEWSGLATSGQADAATTTGTGTATAHATGTSASSNANANDLILLTDAAGGATNTAPTSASAGFTLLTGTNDYEPDGATWWQLGSARKDQTSASTQSGTINWTSNPYWVVLGSFKETGGGGGPTLPVLNKPPNTLIRM